MDTPSLIAENEKRKLKFTSKYDPLSGEGSLLPRLKVNIAELGDLWLPLCMLCEKYPFIEFIIAAGSFSNACLLLKIEPTASNIEGLKKKFEDIRLNEDFEYWAIKTVKIKQKIGNQLMAFKLRYAQQKLLFILEVLFRWIGKPLRTNILKARQWGGSTLIQIYFNWSQVRRLMYCNVLIAADDQGQARNIRGMFSRLAKNYPAEYGKIKLIGFEGSTNIKMIEGREGVIGVGSMQKPESSRSFDYQKVHLSEIGSWKKTDGKEPKDLVQAIRTGISGDDAESAIVQESTAKGTGNYWYDEWSDSISGKSGYYPFFIGYWEIEDYHTYVDDCEKFIETINSWDVKKRDLSWEHWRTGATLESIKWYWNKKEQENLDDWRMMAEYPSKWEEAFQSTNQRTFPAGDVARMRETWKCDPIFVGECIADSDTGKDSILNIRFNEYHSGLLKVWKMPEVGTHRNRYVVTVDIGGTHDDADWSIISVIDRMEFSRGGVPEAVATWQGHIPQDMVAWMAARIATAYDKALVVIESNSLDKKKEEDHFLTVLNVMKEIYENIYCRTPLDKIKEGAPIQYGFHTNPQTKIMIIDHMRMLLRTDGYVEYDNGVLVEYDQYEKHTDGTYGAVQGAHDDKAMSRMIGLWIAYEAMDKCTEIDRSKTTTPNRKLVGAGEANF